MSDIVEFMLEDSSERKFGIRVRSGNAAEFLDKDGEIWSNELNIKGYCMFSARKLMLNMPKMLDGYNKIVAVSEPLNTRIVTYEMLRAIANKDRKWYQKEL